jgi:ATP-dependent Zn protease
MKGVLSTRLSIRKRGYSLGHHQTIETEERFSHWRSEAFAKLIWTLGAMAAERVFYGENTDGVGGDVQSATAAAAWMVGASGMAPEPVDLCGKVPANKVGEREEEIMERFNKIGAQILNRSSSGSFMQGDPIAAVLADPGKRRAAAQIAGRAYLTAQCLVEANRDKLEAIADELVMRREIYGDEVGELLDRQRLRKPTIDLTDPTIWPKL